MRWEKLDDKCIFAFLPELEPLFGVYSLLMGEATHTLCTEIYGAAQIAAWKRRYRFLFETFDAVKALSPFSFFDLLLDTVGEDFDREGFRRRILALPEEERVFRQLGWAYYGGTTRADIHGALNDEAALDALYARVEESCPSFLGFSSFVRDSGRYFEEYFSLAEELDTDALREALLAREAAIDAFCTRVVEALATADALTCSQKLMGKSFRNRGPYETFFFLPSLLLPFSTARFFYDNGTPHNRQILLCSIREPERPREDTLAALRALSDETRYQILMLLARRGPINGQTLVRACRLAPSTVSHHMAELKEHGLVTEEPVKTAKYYGLAKNRLGQIISELQKDFRL